MIKLELLEPTIHGMNCHRRDYIITLSSVPRRFDNTLQDILNAYKSLGFTIVVNIPLAYKKGWEIDESKIPHTDNNVIVHRCSTDWGPATKLLGGIEWCQINNINPIGLITIDDDTLFENVEVLITSLIDESIKKPNHVITRGAIKTVHPPYALGNGLQHNVRDDYADGVAGYLGVYYPFEKFNNSIPFEFLDELPDGFYSEDDAYLGALASKLGCPTWSGSYQPGLRVLDPHSAVEFGLEQGSDRIKRESELYTHLVEAGYLPNNHR